MLSILIIDNNDSFTYNLLEVLRQTGLCKVQVCLLEDIEGCDLDVCDGVILSPGPGLPQEKRGLFELMDRLMDSKPLLGVCLGHQAIAQYFGATLARLQTIIHGESSAVSVLNGHRLFTDLPATFEVGRYHSWAVSEESMPDCFEIGAITPDRIIMSLHHKTKNINTVQFHPESILTEHGANILKNWLVYCVAKKIKKPLGA